MARKITEKLLALLLCIGILCPFCAVRADSASHSDTVAEAERLCDGIIAFKDGYSAQHFINNELCRTAGISAEFYIITLSQKGNYSFSSYEKALLDYLKTHEIHSATSRIKYALALAAAGSRDAYIAQTADEAIGGQGLMSLVFGLHLLNNGCQSKLYTAKGLIDTILGKQLTDGGWAVIGSNGDPDVTAMTLQALAPHYRSSAAVKAAVNRALERLSQLQQDDGGFITMGVENCESAAQVLTALSDLGIDQSKDSRFIKNGNTVMDAMLRYRNTDGSFSHTGGSFNETATMEAFYALTAYIRHCQGKAPLYVLDSRHTPTPVKPTENKKQPSKQPQPKPQSGSQKAPAKTEETQKATDAPPQEYTPDAQEHHETADSGSYQEQPQPQQNHYPLQNDRQQNPPTAAPTEKAEPTTKPTASAPAASVQPTESTTEPAADHPAQNGAGLFQPTETASPETAVEEASPSDKGSYKPYAIAVIVAAALIAAGVLFLLKKRNKKHYIAIAILAAAGVLFILLTDFESKESYQNVQEKRDATGTVTLSIRCDTLKNDTKPDYIPDNCIILDETDFDVAEGDTVYDVLLEASKQHHFQIDNRGAAGSAYIAGIQYLYEFDYGDLSGWMYRIDGEFPDVGCESYRLRGGETIEWLYTKDIGKDL